MDKRKNWQFYLILAVIALTLYNIMPTIFYYSKPLRAPIDQPRAEVVAHDIINRVNSLEENSIEWLGSYSKLLGVKPSSIELVKNDPSLIAVTFKSDKEAKLFESYLSRAGEMIPFVPAQLKVYPQSSADNSNVVYVERNISVHLNPTEANQLFQYTAKYENDKIAPLYREVIQDRVVAVAESIAGNTLTGFLVASAVDASNPQRDDQVLLNIAKEIVESQRAIGNNSEIAKRYYATFTQFDHPQRDSFIDKLSVKMTALKGRLATQMKSLSEENKSLQKKGDLLDLSKSQALAEIESQYNEVNAASRILEQHAVAFKAGKKPLNRQDILNLLAKTDSQVDIKNPLQTLDLSGYNPYIQSITIDWSDDKINLNLYKDVQAIRSIDSQSEEGAIVKEKINQQVIDQIASISRISDESILPSNDGFAINLDKLTNSSSFLAMNLSFLAGKEVQSLNDKLGSGWTPKHPDLVRENYAIRDYSAYKTESPQDQKLGLVIYAPALDKNAPPEGFRTNSIYVIAKGLDSILQKYRDIQDDQTKQMLSADFNELQSILQQSGFIGYSGAAYGMGPEFQKDYIFERNDYYSDLLKASYEDFFVKGSKRYAVLQFTDVEQRILTENKIDNSIHENLLKWKEEYNSAQVDLNPAAHFLVPKPTKNVYWDNFKLSFVKYFRGDDRKILKWGLDLSGGKTVRIGLRDSNNRPVTNPDDLKQASNELYNRINAMGVAERTIRIENNTIVLDFPGSQGLSAAELVKASSMYFHVVNEKFSTGNKELAPAVNKFLQEVWNEAVVTNRKDIQSINEIAWQHLGGNSDIEIAAYPRSEAANTLFANGLRLADPHNQTISAAFNDALSSIAILRGEDASLWNNQTHPLLITFHNYALEGSSLTNIQVGYDATDGNVLQFAVKRSYENASRGQGSPRDDFYTWTSNFSEERIAGTAYDAYTGGRGWRMAVVLNGEVISAPTLRAALRDAATISGRFSQREVNQLAADLKAGSLSFTPRILSEQNVSPELGAEERTKGITAAVIALLLVFVCMIGYYRFAGVVASCAVVFNLLIMWGILQNIDAALTLPGIAGLVLTIAMAIDANVLVFERVREEFLQSGRIASALQAGYRKAFSAIIDSNLTTIMVALILVQFDSGPIKGFAVVLIIGIISSMFTALFMTRWYFAGWVQNPNNKTLNMSHWIGKTNFDFLAQSKKAIILSAIILVAGLGIFLSQSKTIFGMDFTGGYSLTVELQDQPNEPNYRDQALKALQASGASINDIQIRELSRPNQLRIQLGISMEEKGHPFYNLPEAITDGKYAYEYQSNPRITWVVNSLESHGLPLQAGQLENLNKSWTVMSGQLSDSMRNNAIMGIVLALIGILVYVTFRFEFKYGIGAVIGLVHDVLITLGITALFHQLGFPVQIDLQVIGAIMMIIGYSLNDTIIVFDRIREEVKVLRKWKFEDIINHALNVTLSRTLMTSGTTLIVLLALLVFGGSSMFGFTLVMTIGIFVGTLSSLFIAAPVMLYFHYREQGNENGRLAKV